MKFTFDADKEEDEDEKSRFAAELLASLLLLLISIDVLLFDDSFFLLEKPFIKKKHKNRFIYIINTLTYKTPLLLGSQLKNQISMCRNVSS